MVISCFADPHRQVALMVRVSLAMMSAAYDEKLRAVTGLGRCCTYGVSSSVVQAYLPSRLH